MLPGNSKQLFDQNYNNIKFQIPNAKSVTGLLIPHFSLGLGIGTLDAALIPYMASLVDSKYGDDESTSS